MSAYMRTVNGGPLPVVNDKFPWESAYQNGSVGPPAMSPWQQALAGKQDTGGGETISMPGKFSDGTPIPRGGETISRPGTWADGTPIPRVGGNAFGTTYADPGGGWNPWSLYDGREGFDGTAVDGWYNAAADSKKGWGPNGTPESDRDRVWRMTLADLGPNPGGQSPERVKAAFLNNVARLKRDYLDTPGMGAQAWAASAFAGYDKLPGTQGGTGQGLGGATDMNRNGGTVPPSPSRGPGGNGMATPNDPLNPYNTPNGSTGTQPGGTTNPSTLVNATTSPNGGTSHQGGGTYGKFTTPDIESVLAEIQTDPSKAALIWRAMQGHTKPAIGRMANTRDTLYGQSLQALLGLGGLPGMGSMTDLLGDFNTQVSQPGGLSGLGTKLGGKLGSMDLGALNSLDLDKVLSTVAALRGVNMGKLGKNAMGTQLENVMSQDWLQQAAAGETDDYTNYASDLTNTDYGRALMQFLGAGGGR